MVFKIIKYSSEFQSAIVDLWKKCGLVVPQNEPVQDIQSKTSFQPDLFFVALLNDKVIGSIMVGYEGHRGWINYLAVLPEHQRHGYGRRLVEKGIEELQTLGCVKVNLQVRKSNVSVIEFYRHLGFKEEDRISMGKRLK